MKPIRLIGALLVVVACVALTGAALASKGTRPARRLPHRVHVQQQQQQQQQQPGEESAENESESAGESEAGQPGEPAQGHEDPPGQEVNHECTGNCQE